MANKDYSIDWTKHVVTMTKKFAEEANMYGTPAYRTVSGFRRDGFQITVRKTEKRKACPTRLTFKQMEQYLSCLTNADEHIAGLHAIMGIAKAQKNPYEHVRQWFLQNYPNFREIPKLNSDLLIDAPHLKLVDEKNESIGA
jgi:hypothetical protein